MTTPILARGAVCAFIFAALTAFAPATQAATITYNYEGPLFSNFSDTTASAKFVPGDRVTGSVSFDESLLNSFGSGFISSSSAGINPGLAWSFEDGHNLFNNTNTTTNFAIDIAFTAFEATYWYIDTTSGVTDQADIFEYGELSRFGGFEADSVSWFEGETANGSCASQDNACQPWSRPAAAVPLPAGFPLMLAGLGAFAVLRRRAA